MAKNNEPNLNQWVNDRLGSVRPDEQWLPDAIRGFERLQQQLDGGTRRRRLAGIAAGIAGVILCLAFPATRTLAARYASACASFLADFTGSHGKLTSIKRPDRKIAPDFALTDNLGAR